MNDWINLDEIQGMIVEINDSLEVLEKSYGIAINHERCKLWAKQKNLIHQVQQELERLDEKASDPQPIEVKKEISLKKIKAAPNLGY